MRGREEKKPNISHPSHIISVILQIDQKVDEDWPLTIIDHKGTFILIAIHNLVRNGVLVPIKLGY